MARIERILIQAVLTNQLTKVKNGTIVQST